MFKLTGVYDAIVTSSDEDAIQFYLKQGFSDNPILNFKYKMIGDSWTNTTKMCYVPPYSTDTLSPISGKLKKIII
jgi:hypothetical protein